MMDNCNSHISSFSSKDEMYEYIMKSLKRDIENTMEQFSQFECRSGGNNSLQPSTICALSNAASLIFYIMNSDRRYSCEGEHSKDIDFSQTFHDRSFFKLNWVGFYFVINSSFLTLGPFQGKVASTLIEIGKGVCGTAVLLGKTQRVNDVQKFPGYNSCHMSSKSEIAVPIRNQDGLIMGILDVHSTSIGNFDDVDIRRLTEISVLLGSHLHFPGVADTKYQRMAGSIKGTLLGTDHSHTSILKAPECHSVFPAPQPVCDGTSAVLNRENLCETNKKSLPGNVNHVCPMIPTIRTKCIGETLKVVEKTFDRIYSNEEAKEWESSYNITHIPEILFPCNELHIFIAKYKSGSSGDSHYRNDYIHLCVNSLEFLKDAKKFYLTQSYKKLIETDEDFLKIPVSESWKNSNFLTHDPAIDWAFRGEYLGTLFCKLIEMEERRLFFKPISETEHPPKHSSINYEMLRRKDLDILFFGSFDLFEDDLHDAGVSKATVKFRVMPTCVFVLLRHVVRVDMAGAVCRDVRFYHEMTSSLPINSLSSNCIATKSSMQSPCHYNDPYIVAEVSHRHIRFDGESITNGRINRKDFCSVPCSELSNEKATLLKLPLDELVEKMTPLSVGGHSEPMIFIASLDDS
eukprot:Tbor_TRINITY_DN2351_c0_g1::TRINITY_DN2351_c0_g1_i1::g.86::m.86